MNRKMISSPRSARPTRMIRSSRLPSNIVFSPWPSLHRRQTALLQGDPIECLALPADEQHVVAFEHFRTLFVRLDHHVVRAAVMVVDLGPCRVAHCGAAGD